MELKNFEFFIEKCKYTKFFDCHIVTSDYKLLMIENDLERILEINPENIFFFWGEWEPFTITKKGKVKYHDWYTDVASDDEIRNKDGDDLGSSNARHLLFDIAIAYFAYRKGVDSKIIETWLPQMYETFCKQLDRDLAKTAAKWWPGTPESEWKEWADSIRKREHQDWEWSVEGWRDECSLIESFSPEDTILFEKIKWSVGDFDWMIPMESHSAGEGQLCNIVWNTIKLVRNGGDADDVIKHLKDHGRMWPDEVITRNLREIQQIRDNPEEVKNPDQRIEMLEWGIKQEMDKKDSFENNCTETAQKIVNLIRES